MRGAGDRSFNMKALVATVATVLVWLLPASPAIANEMCRAPQTDAEKLVCEDDHLRGLDNQINVLLWRFRDYGDGEVPEAVQMEYGHHMIGREDCDASLRCVESEMVAYLQQLGSEYLDWEDNPLSDVPNIGFQLFQSQDSPGNDIAPISTDGNYGWTQDLCQRRCANDSLCIGVGYDPLQSRNGVAGYCTMKSQVTLPLKIWTNTGMFLLKQ